MENLTENKLIKLTQEWKDRLGLQDWKIAVRICRQSDMQLDEAAGENQYIHECKTAQIDILDTIDYGDRMLPQDQEETLVHELLHCLFSVIDTEDVIQDRVQHQIIATLAKALVDAKRYREGE